MNTHVGMEQSEYDVRIQTWVKDSVVMMKLIVQNANGSPIQGSFSVCITSEDEGKADSLQSSEREMLLDEVVKTGRKIITAKNPYGVSPPRRISRDDAKKSRVPSLKSLLLPLGVKFKNENGRETFRLCKVYVDNVACDEDDLSDVLAIQPTDVSSVEYFPPNNPVNTLFRVDAELGEIPGVLFIFLNDSSEAEYFHRGASTFKQQDEKDNNQLRWHFSNQHGCDYKHLTHHKTLYWNAITKTDSEGCVSIQFLIRNDVKNCLLTIQGTLIDGTIVSKVISVSLEKRAKDVD